MRFAITILLLSAAFSGWSQIQLPGIDYLNVDSVASQKLKSVNGKKLDLKAGSASLYLMIFLSPECPLCINYTRTLNEFAEEFAGKVSFIGIVPGKAYKRKEVSKFSNEYRLKFNLYIDEAMNVTRFANATVTPEVVLFDSTGLIVYRGAIDDWAVALGKKKQKAAKLYLHSAIQEHLLGRQVMVKQVKPVGCIINDY